MRKIEVKIRQIIWAFNESFKPSKCYSVEFQGVTCNIKHSFTGYNKWHVTSKLVPELKWRNIHGSELIVNLHSFKRWYNNFTSCYKHQKWSWYLIDIRNPLGTRLSYINSDNIKFKYSY